MVRVLSRVPFNLRNDPENGLPNTASSSRSNRSPSTNLSYTHHTRASDQFGRNSNGRRSSSKVAPSPSISRSESASSIQQASMSRVSTDDLTDPYMEHKLKVQLIPTMKSKQRVYSRRGRSKTKQGRFTDEADGTDNVPTLEGIQSVDSGRGNFDAPEEQYPIKNTEEIGASSGSNNADRPQTTPLSDEENLEVRHYLNISQIVIPRSFHLKIKGISRELSSKLIKDEFEDVGMLTRSWGD